VRAILLVPFFDAAQQIAQDFLVAAGMLPFSICASDSFTISRPLWR